MAVQIVTTKYEVDFSDYEQFSEVLKQNAKDAGLSEEEIESYAKSVQKQADKIQLVEKALKAEREESIRLARALKEATDAGDQDRLQKELAQSDARLKALTTDARKLGIELKKAGDEGEKASKGIGFGDLQSEAESLPGALGDIAGRLGVVGKIGTAAIGGAVVTAAVAATQKLIEMSDEVRQIQTSVSQTFGDLADNELSAVAGQAEAIAQTFGIDLTQVLEAAKSRAEEFGISSQQALTELGDGLIFAQNKQSELLEETVEFSNFLKQVGLDSRQALALQTQALNSGILDGRALDQIKEISLSLRELTPAAREALNGIGITNEEINRRIQDGSISSFEFIQQLSAEVDKIGPSSQAAGLIFADVTKSAGEDAQRFFLDLANISLEWDNIAEGASNAEKAQQELLQSATELETQYQALFQDSVFSELGDEIELLTNNVLTRFIQEIRVVGANVRGVGRIISETFQNIRLVGQVALGGLFDAIRTGSLDPLRDIGGIISQLRDSSIERIQGIKADVRKELIDIYNPPTDALNEVAQSQVNTFTQRIRSASRSQLPAIAREFSGVFRTLVDSDQVNSLQAQSAVGQLTNLVRDRQRELTKFSATLTAEQKKAQDQTEKLRQGIEGLSESLGKISNAEFQIITDSRDVEQYQSAIIALADELERLENARVIDPEEIRTAQNQLKALTEDFKELLELDNSLIELQIEVAGGSGTVAGLELLQSQALSEFQESIGITVPINPEFITSGDRASIESLLIADGFNEASVSIITDSLFNLFKEFEEKKTNVQKTEGEKRTLELQKELAAIDLALSDSLSLDTSQAALDIQGELDAIKQAFEDGTISSTEFVEREAAIQAAALKRTSDLQRDFIAGTVTNSVNAVASIERQISAITGATTDQIASLSASDIETSFFPPEQQAELESLIALLREYREAVNTATESQANFNEEQNNNDGSGNRFELTETRDAFEKLRDSLNGIGELDGGDLAGIGAFALQQADAIFNAQLSRLDSLKEAEIKAAGDSAQERERIEREYARRRGRLLIAQAIAQGSLAIIQAFAELGPIAGGIAAAFVALQTGIQIGNIRREVAGFKEGVFDLGNKKSAFQIKGKGTTTSDSIPANLSRGETVFSALRTNQNYDLFQGLDKGKMLNEFGINGQTFYTFGKDYPELSSTFVGPDINPIIAPDFIAPDRSFFAPDIKYVSPVFGPSEVGLNKKSITTLSNQIADKMAFRDDETRRIDKSRGDFVQPSELARMIAKEISKELKR